MSVELRWKVRVLTISSSVCSSVVVFCLELQCVHVCVEMLSTGGECCVEKSPLIRAGRHCIRLKCACVRVRACLHMSVSGSFFMELYMCLYPAARVVKCEERVLEGRSCATSTLSASINDLNGFTNFQNLDCCLLELKTPKHSIDC